jgi:TPR repeat protein
MRNNLLAALLCVAFLSSSPASLAQIQLRIKSDYEAGVGMHERGNIKMAITFFEQGTAKGDPKSMFALGSHYHFGEGVSKDLPKARELFERASAVGLADADAMLGIIYREGQGVNKDSGRAIAYLKKASNSCSDSAQEFLAQMLYEGEGIEKDRVEALAYLYLAAKVAANQKAHAGVAYVEREVTPTERDKAKLRALEIQKAMQCPAQ